MGAVSTSSDSTVNAAITFGGKDAYGIYTSKDNYGKIGEQGKSFYRAYIKNVFSDTIEGDVIRDSEGNKYLCFKEASVTGTNSAGNAYFTDESSDLAKKAGSYHIWMALVANPPAGGQYVCMPFRTWRGAIGLGSLNGENYVWGSSCNGC